MFGGRRRPIIQALNRLTARGETDLRFIEVGTGSGELAQAVAKAWCARSRDNRVYYLGLDLFDELTEAKSIAEGLETFVPVSLAATQQTLTAVPGMSARLIQGNSRETFHAVVRDIEQEFPDPNLVIIDGGQSPQTLEDDVAQAAELVRRHPELLCLVDRCHFKEFRWGAGSLFEAVRRKEIPRLSDMCLSVTGAVEHVTDMRFVSMLWLRQEGDSCASGRLAA